MNAKYVSLAGLLLVQIGACVLLFVAIRAPEKYGLILLGAAVGWMLYYFIRRYKLFSPQSLAATLSAILGGEGLAWLAHLRGGGENRDLQYFTGLGVGFFIYSLYAGFCAWLFAAGIIRTPFKFEIAVGCGAGNMKDLGEIEELIEFEEKARQWLARDINDDNLRLFIDGLEMGKKKLLKYLSTGEIELKSNEITQLKEAGFLDS
jgi:signal transduction histidine kinase